MQWIIPFEEKHIATDNFQKRTWASAEWFRADSGLIATQISESVLGLSFLRFAQVALPSGEPSWGKPLPRRDGVAVWMGRASYSWAP